MGQVVLDHGVDRRGVVLLRQHEDPAPCRYGDASKDALSVSLDALLRPPLTAAGIPSTWIAARIPTGVATRISTGIATRITAPGVPAAWISTPGVAHASVALVRIVLLV